MTRSVDGDLPIDAVLRNTYKIVSVLGRGGMGSVFLAQHLRLPGKQVAVKVLRTGDHLTAEIHTRFRREAEIASRLGHPNIVEVLDFDTLEDGSPFLVLEFLRGESLADRLKRGRMSLEEVSSFVRQVGSALQTAHRAGIVHRDLKPANVFLVPTDSGGVVGERVKLLDFGISKVMSSETLQTQEAVLIGTPQYMSPEQAQGRNREIDARTDEFALGVIVFEMLSGMSPFGGGSLAQIIYRIVHEPPISLASLMPELPAHVIAGVERALAKNPDDRFPDIAGFVAALTGVQLQSLPVSAAVLEARAGTRTSPSGIALPSSAEDPASLSGTLGPGSQSGAQPPGTGRFGQAPAGGDTMGFGATLAPGGTARFGQPLAAAGDDLGTGDTLAPGGTARFGQPAAASDATGFGATLVKGNPSPASPQGTLPYGAPQAAATGPAPVQAAPASVVAHGPGQAGQLPVSSGTNVPSAPMAASGANVPSTPMAASGMNVPSTPMAAPTAVPAQAAVGQGPKSRGPMVAVAAVLLLGAVGVGWWLRPGTPPAQPPVVTGNPPQATNVPPQTVTLPAQPDPTPQAVAPPTSPTPQTTEAPQPAGTPPPNAVSSVKPVTNRPVRPEVLPDAVRAILDEGETALRKGHADEAADLGAKSQRQKPSSAGFSLLARAYCRKGDLGNAMAQARKVASGELPRVKQYCKQYDIDINL